MNTLKQRIITLFAAVALSIGFVAPVPSASAVDIISNGCKAGSSSSVCANKGDNAVDLIKVVIDIMFFLLGIIAVIMIIIGGVRYTTSNGDASNLTGAKNTILYSVIGLVIRSEERRVGKECRL